MTNQTTANQSNTVKKEKEESQRDDNTEVAYKDAGHCSRNTHNLLLALTIMGTQGRGNSGRVLILFFFKFDRNKS